MFSVNNNFTHIIKNSYSTTAAQCYKTKRKEKKWYQEIHAILRITDRNKYLKHFLKGWKEKNVLAIFMGNSDYYFVIKILFEQQSISLSFSANHFRFVIQL